MIVASSGLQIAFSITGDLELSALEGGVDDAGGKTTSAAGKLNVEFTGVDTPLLTARNGELLNALEHLAAKALRLDEQDHDHIFFDADSYKADRDRELRRNAESAIDSVRNTGRPYAFRAMTSHERRLLHLVLKESGLPTASTGETPRRFVVLYPEGHDPAESPASNSGNSGVPAMPVRDRVNAIRSSFRRR